jgi:Fe-Mn family superoxide dismutase
MKRNSSLLLFVFTLVLISCNDKKLTEVVEVPLPAAEEKMTIGVLMMLKLKKVLLKW